MGRTFAIAVNRIRLLIASRRNALLLLLPVLFLAGIDRFAGETVSESKIPIVIADSDESEISQQVVSAIKKNPVLKVLVVGNETEAQELVETQKAAAGFHFPEGMGEELLANEADEIVTVWTTPTVISTAAVQEMVAAEILRPSANSLGAETAVDYAIKAQGKMSKIEQDQLWKEVWEYSDSQWSTKPLMTIQDRVMGSGTVTVPDPNQPRPSPNLYLPGTLAIMMLFAFAWSGWAIQEKNSTITSRLFLTIKPRQYVAGNLIAMLLLQSVLLAGFILYGKQASYWDAEELPKAVATLLIYAFLITAFVFWLAHHVHSMKSWGMITITVLLLSSLFSGTFIPLNEISERLQQIAYFTPQFWASDSMQGSISFPVLAGMAALGLLMAALTTQKAGVQR
ncbi:hypothetical protein CGZ90_12735 [Fictibacillus aquaticus]|uniref:ABC-2 type transporter transmembrane domain-containing protein n=1 Tax=Fictibacillus aquaticus TaxID=2021314 RepID=A0A235F853_9BACL|nr:ABC transporter permease [Fictibacillus aquaticus]OYD57531.1 hypothetical protein CGZ90_12735 [Fictibacillus aquaticus]